jgi:uncharacterized membrane protein SpoIIM required for sporulation
MVLESLFPVKKVLKNPVDMFIFSFVISIVSIFLANLIFPGSGSGKAVTLFITVAMTPMVYAIFKKEEEEEREEAEHKISMTFWERRSDVIWLFTLFFLGNFMAVFLFSISFPEKYVSMIFEDQITEIERITSISGAMLYSDILTMIVKNNLRVMFLSFILSLVIGTGAIVILSWNASILALYLASFIRKGLIGEFFIRTFGLIPHAPIEIFAYFLAGIAGGILSVGMIRENLLSKEFFLVFKDSVLMLLFAVLSILIGAFIEVFL